MYDEIYNELFMTSAGVSHYNQTVQKGKLYVTMFFLM